MPILRSIDGYNQEDTMPSSVSIVRLLQYGSDPFFARYEDGLGTVVFELLVLVRLSLNSCVLFAHVTYSPYIDLWHLACQRRCCASLVLRRQPLHLPQTHRHPLAPPRPFGLRLWPRT